MRITAGQKQDNSEKRNQIAARFWNGNQAVGYVTKWRNRVHTELEIDANVGDVSDNDSGAR